MCKSTFLKYAKIANRADSVSGNNDDLGARSLGNDSCWDFFKK